MIQSDLILFHVNLFVDTSQAVIHWYKIKLNSAHYGARINILSKWVMNIDITQRQPTPALKKNLVSSIDVSANV